MGSRTQQTTCVVQSFTPTEPGPASAIRYDVLVQTEQGVISVPGAASAMMIYPDEVACVGSPPGSHHPASITGDRLRLFIPPIPITITCEDIE